MSELHQLYGCEKPAFVQESRCSTEGTQVGIQKNVVLATADGSHPYQINAKPIYTSITIEVWNEQYYFWTLEVENRRFIIAEAGRSILGGVAYRRWLGLGKKNQFENKNFAFPVTLPNPRRSELLYVEDNSDDSSDTSELSTV